MTTPFDTIAPVYAELWSDTSRGASQRQEVWRELDALFEAGQRVLDLGCGTGDDALHLARRGVSVTGIDLSPNMVAVARSRGVDAKHAHMEAMPELGRPFDGAFSNFGALNCVDHPHAAVLRLTALLQPGALVAVCVLSRFHWRESAEFLKAGDVRRAVRRWRGRTQWRGIRVHYRTVREWRRIFAPGFRYVRSQAIGGGDHRLIVFRRSGV